MEQNKTIEFVNNKIDDLPHKIQNLTLVHNDLPQKIENLTFDLRNHNMPKRMCILTFNPHFTGAHDSSEQQSR